MRVRWIHDCPMKTPSFCGYALGGNVWRPNFTGTVWSQMTDYEIAESLGLTADSAPDSDRQFAMVAWDCRPGVLQVHYWDELEELKP